MDYQWYPGHMTKARRMMQENIGLVDLVIELADARIPLSSRNPDIDSLCGNKARILLMTKADMADPVRTAKFQPWTRAPEKPMKRSKRMWKRRVPQNARGIREEGSSDAP